MVNLPVPQTFESKGTPLNASYTHRVTLSGSTKPIPHAWSGGFGTPNPVNVSFEYNNGSWQPGWCAVLTLPGQRPQAVAGSEDGVHFDHSKVEIR